MSEYSNSLGRLKGPVFFTRRPDVFDDVPENRTPSLPERIHQNISFSTNSNTRGSSARVIVPNAALPKLLLGAERRRVGDVERFGAELGANRSVIGNVLPSITSSVR